MDIQCAGISGDIESLDQFQSEKKVCLEVVKNLMDLTKRMNSSSAYDSLSRLSEELSQEHFYLAVLGSFKRGKSTFINALLGTNLVPTGIVPLTSIITKIRYGSETRAEVTFKDRRKILAGIDDLEGYITERGNPDNVRNVQDVDIFMDNDLLSKGVVLVDTPGIGSTYLKNTLTTYDFLSRMDAAIFILAIDPPISQTELEFLQDVKNHVDRIFFIQNKIDNASETEWREAVDFSLAVMKEAVGAEDLKIYPMTARSALEARIQGDAGKLEASGMVDLEKDLKDFLVSGRGRAIIQSASRKIMKIISDISSALQIERKVIEKPPEEMKSKLEWLEQEIENSRRKMNEMDYLMDGNVASIINRFTMTLDEFKANEEPILVEDIEHFLERLDDDQDPKQCVQDIERFISESIANTYTPFIAEQESKVLGEFKSVVARFEKEINELSYKVQKEVTRSFDISMESFTLGEIPVERTRFYFDQITILNYDTILPGELPLVLPRILLRMNLKKRAVNSVKNELDKHAGRIRYDFDYRLSESARKAKSELRTRMLLTLEAINNAVKSGQKHKKEAVANRQTRIEDLSRFEEAVASEKDRVSAIAACTDIKEASYAS